MSYTKIYKMTLLEKLCLVVIVTIVTALFSCSKDDDSPAIPCQKNIMEGTWNVNRETNIYFEVKDSTDVSEFEYVSVYHSNGAGFHEFYLVNDHFTWFLQCSPDRLVINNITGPPLAENPYEDPMDYDAASQVYQLTQITDDEIKMSSEYYRGENETRRKVTESLIYTRVE
jgi:hypothetical protein